MRFYYCFFSCDYEECCSSRIFLLAKFRRRSIEAADKPVSLRTKDKECPLIKFKVLYTIEMVAVVGFLRYETEPLNHLSSCLKAEPNYTQSSQQEITLLNQTGSMHLI